ncbi:hypothetical protein [Heyndrickxia sporothermodurans]|uniref:hypothetical protein n=1 Tax=Heyndrickxia sporothermodurans TaxID=46224 RepID=UPI002E1B3730|nr:hypothetical protein [Bacillus thuringiensis]
MSKPFEFADFVDEFKVPFISIVKVDGHWEDGGDWIPGGEKSAEMQGILLPLTQEDLRYSEAGTFSVKDKKIYTVEPLEEGQQIEYKGDKYTVQSFKDYSDYADVFIYHARWREK